MKKIKVLHLIKSLGRGGAEMLLPETLKIHDKQGFEFHYIYFLPWKNQMVESLRGANGIVSCFDSSNNLAILMKYRQVASYIKLHRIQVIHCHLPWAGFLGRFLFRGLGIPVVYTEHNKQERYHWVTRWLNRLTFNWQSSAIAVSEDVATSIRQHIAPRIPIITICNGVNTSRFRRNLDAGKMIRLNAGIPADAIVVGTVTVFRTQKRLKDWLDVFATVARSESKLWGMVVGDGPLMKEVNEHRMFLGLQNRVVFPGLQTNIIPWLSAMDIFMMTSLFEGLPIALLEAMSSECAVLTTDAGGIKEVIRPDVDGFRVPVSNPGQLVTYLTRLVGNSDERRRLSLGARARVEGNFELSAMAQALERLYQSIS